MDKVMHYGFMSSVTTADQDIFYTTVDNNEVIEFITSEGIQRNVNALTIYANTSDLFVELQTGYCVYVKSNSSISVDYLNIKSMKVLGLAGQSIRFYAMYH